MAKTMKKRAAKPARKAKAKRTVRAGSVRRKVKRARPAARKTKARRRRAA
jgi:hypothetical protein